MSPPASKGWSRAARSASHGACAIICAIVAAWSLRIWASSWSRTSPIRSERFACIGEDTSEHEASPEEPAESAELPSPMTISDLFADNEVALELALWDSVKDGGPAELGASGQSPTKRLWIVKRR